VVDSADGSPAVGDRVAMIPAIPCRRCRACRMGQQNACADREIIGIHRWGGYAEYLSAPPENLVVIPPATNPVEAAAMPVTYATAWHMVTKRANVRPGDTVLVVGATGNVGYASAQVAGLLGARVILAGRGEDRMRRLADDLGGMEFVDVERPDVVDHVRGLTGGRGADVVVETVGPATWEMSLAAIAVEGRLVSSGGGSGTQLTMSLPDVYRRNITLAFSSQGTHQDARDMFRSFARGLLRPRVGQVFPHAEVVEAHRALAASGGPMGKVVLRYGT